MSDADLPPLAVGPEGPDGPLDGGVRERRRRRTARRVMVTGVILAVVAAAGVGAVTASGASSLAALFTGLALASAVTAVVTLVGAARDEIAGVRVPRGRILRGLGFLVGAPILLLLAAGAAGAS